MIDPKLIQENYAKMSDGQLVNLAQTEGQDLTGEALTMLHDEFLNRNLDTAVFGTVDDNKTAREKRNIRQAQESASNEFANSIWLYAFDEKESGATNNEIYKGLLDRGLGDEHSMLIIRTLGSKAKEILENHEANITRGVITCAIGLLITVWTFSSAINGGTYIFAWGAIVFGAIRFFKGLSNKDKYKKILENIEAEGSYDTTMH